MIGMMTAPRPVSTLSDSLNSVRQAGWNKILVTAEPGTDQVPNVIWSPNNRKLGVVKNFLRLTKLLLEANQDPLIIFQDDIEVAEGCREYLETNWPFGTCGVLSLYCPANNHRTGFYGFLAGPKDPSSRYGALAMAMTADTASGILATGLPLESALDIQIGQWCHRTYTPYRLHIPSLVRHTGETSALGSVKGLKGNRQCGVFLGDCGDIQNLNDDRDQFRTDFDRCMICQGDFKQFPSGCQIHEIARGVHRSAAVKRRSTWLLLDDKCHRAVGGADLWPIAAQLAVKKMRDPEYYNRVQVNRIRGRQPDAVTEREVTDWIIKLRCGHGGYRL